MKHFLLKFNAGVEIGARLAYDGHALRLIGRNSYIYKIIRDEIQHRREVVRMLEELGEKPSPFIDGCFTLIGKTIFKLCQVSPEWSLNWVASTMELFAVVNYRKLAGQYPQFKDKLNEMADMEHEHEVYFKYGPNKLRELIALKKSLVGGSLGVRRP